MIAEPTVLNALKCRLDGTEVTGGARLHMTAEIERGKTITWPPGAEGDDIQQKYKENDKFVCFHIAGISRLARDRRNFRLELWTHHITGDAIDGTYPYIYWQFLVKRVGKSWVTHGGEALQTEWMPDGTNFNQDGPFAGMYCRTDKEPPQ